MRTLAQKPTAARRTRAAKPEKPGRAHLGQSREVDAMLYLQRTLGNQAVQELLPANAQERSRENGLPQGRGNGQHRPVRRLSEVIQQRQSQVWSIQRQEAAGTAPPAEAVPAAEETAEEESCALTTFTSGRFTNKTPVIDVEFKSAMDTIESYANSRDVTVYVTDSFREAGHTPSGAIVTPATKSNHKAGHAIDMNLQHDGKHYNSKKLKKSKLGSQPEAVKGFIKDIQDDAGLRWGGDFTDEDPVHIDDHLNASDEAWQKRFDATQKARKSGCG